MKQSSSTTSQKQMAYYVSSDILKATRVLIVDDAPVMRQVIRGFLKDLSIHNIDDADSIDIASQRVKLIEYDLIILDAHVGEASGYQLLSYIRKSDNPNQNSNVIVISSEAKKDDVTLAISLGISGYLVKPFSQEKLRLLIEKALIS